MNGRLIKMNYYCFVVAVIVVVLGVNTAMTQNNSHEDITCSCDDIKDLEHRIKILEEYIKSEFLRDTEARTRPKESTTSIPNQRVKSAIPRDAEESTTSLMVTTTSKSRPQMITSRSRNEETTTQPTDKKTSKRFNYAKEWFAPGNGYEYLLPKTKQNWREGRKMCQERGGDLAAVGMRNIKIRRALRVALRRHRDWVFIGASDAEEEGNWKWIDGVPGMKKNIFWLKGDPDGGKSQNCAMLNYRLKKRTKAIDVGCDKVLRALCEREIGQ